MILAKLEKYWKIWMMLPIAFLVISIGILVYNTMSTGFIMQRDIELSGGKMITIEVINPDIQKITAAIPYANVRLTTGATKSLLIEIPFDADEKKALDDIKNAVEMKGEPSIRTIGPALGNVFFQQAQLAIVIAFIFMAVTVFILFRSFMPSTIILLAATTDIVGSMVIISILGIKFSLPVLAALLTLIGYSVDTDILLTSELLKSGRSDFRQSIKRAMKTGLTMTFTTLAALFALYFVSGSFVIEQIAFVLIVGLLIDIPATWLTNAGLMRWHLERLEKKGEIK